MENASKALIMACGVLIGVLLLSLAAYLFVDFGSTAAKINEQNAQQRVVEFNSRFTSYENRTGLTIYDVITVLGYAQENNAYYVDNLSEYEIKVRLQGEVGTIENWDEDDKISRIQKDIANASRTSSISV